MRRYTPAVLVSALLLFAGGIVIATAETADPCDLATTDLARIDCRLDRIEKHLGVPIEPSPSVTPSPSDSPTPSITPSVTPTPTPTSPSPTPTQPPSGFPDAGNTGVPDGVTLTAYTGPKTITVPTVIDGKLITGRLVVKADLKITRSRLDGTVDADYNKPVTIEDSNVNAGSTTSYPAVGYGDVTIRRSEITGGQHNVLCGTNCLVEDSWLHSQALPSGSSFHNNAYISNGGSNVILRHNTVQCTTNDNSSGGGCTADVSFFGDFSVISNITVTGNLFKTTRGYYCGTFGHNPSKPYGSNPTNVKVTDNVFERGTTGKCGYGGPVTSFKTGGGNAWSGNKFEDGTPVNP